MQVHFGVELMHAEWDASVACIGTFDGIHLGHQRVIATAVEHARAMEAPCAVVTFDRHPSAILAPEKKPFAISSLEDNLLQFKALGAAVALVLPFDQALSETPAQEFFDVILKGELHAEHIVVGHDFGFGRGREGNGPWLQERVRTTIVEALLIQGQRISSSAIRSGISGGRVELAETYLGRPFKLHGVVVGGRKLGRTLGFPTINLARSFEQILPAVGVYAGRCQTPFGAFGAAISIGTSPTIADGLPRTIEAFLLDYPGQALYGMDVGLEFLARIRDQERFDSIEALMRQMAQDVEIVAKLCAQT